MKGDLVPYNVASKAATLTWLTKAMVHYHLQKLNQAGNWCNGEK